MRNGCPDNVVVSEDGMTILEREVGNGARHSAQRAVDRAARCGERRRSGLRGKELRGNAPRGNELRGNGTQPYCNTHRIGGLLIMNNNVQCITVIDSR